MAYPISAEGIAADLANDSGVSRCDYLFPDRPRLKLESAKESVQVLVVNSVVRPGANWYLLARRSMAHQVKTTDGSFSTKLVSRS